MNKVDGPYTDKSEWIKLEFLINPDNPASGSLSKSKINKKKGILVCK
jgi:hypothetical protein